MTGSLTAEQSQKENAGSGLGRGKAPSGASGARRHNNKKRARFVLRDNIQGLTKPAIRRLARRGGVKRIEMAIYEETRGVLKIFLTKLIRDTTTYTEYARRKTVTYVDVKHALKNQGRTVYGIECVNYDSVPEKSARKPIKIQEKAKPFLPPTPSTPTPTPPPPPLLPGGGEPTAE